MINKQNIRLIFGLKLKQLRQQKGLSFADLSKSSGLSVSYLNEIEKGKKYPKTDKIISLAEALGVSYDQLVSLKLSRKLTPIAELLNSGILESLPLEMFGLEISTLLDLISDAPTKINAFISTIIKVARNYEMTQENFYFAALRSYQEMHDNYFEDLEVEVDAFVEKYGIEVVPPISIPALEQVLCHHYQYSIDRLAIDQYPELNDFRSIAFPEQKRLLINSKLTEMQQCFQLGKELAYLHLGMKDRPALSNAFQVHTFEEVLNNFKASYFSVALMLNRQLMIADLNAFFERKHWEPDIFLGLINKYHATPEMFLHRLTSLLPKYFGIDSLFFLRFNDNLDQAKDNFHITKELHLSRLHSPHRNDLNEHYCRRWVSIGVLQDMRDGKIGDEQHLVARAQRSNYINSKSDYLCITIGRPNTPSSKTNISVTLGIQVDAASKKRISWLESGSITSREVNETCERCPLSDCKERAAPPAVHTRAEKRELILRQLHSLQDQLPATL
ncbi:MAG: XRE family transcriptional regulator [Bacteroidia bacterium]|nr:XRE family transcriptional regulator [Bacteroidia bacterium]